MSEQVLVARLTSIENIFDELYEATKKKTTWRDMIKYALNRLYKKDKQLKNNNWKSIAVLRKYNLTLDLRQIAKNLAK